MSGSSPGLALLLLAGAIVGIVAVSPAAGQGSAEPAGARPQSAAQVVEARDSALEAKVKLVASQLRCPVCQGLSLQDSPSELAQEMKAVVRERLAMGQTPDEVKAYFVSKYGQWILLEPEPHGINLAVYLLPFAAVLGGGTVIALSVRRWTRRGSGGGGEGEGEGKD